MRMSGIIAISSRILRRKTNIINIRNVNQNRPLLNTKRPKYLVECNRFDEDNNNEYENLNEPVGALGYILLSIPIVSFALGTWQIERRKWKLGVLNDLKKRTSSSPQPLPDDLSKVEEMEYYPVKVRGEFLYDREFAIGPKSRIKDGASGSSQGGIMSTSGNTGYYIITPFKLENRDVTILINRGWVPRKDLPKEKLGHVPGVVEITGIVRSNEKRQPLMPKNTPSAGVWVHRDLDAMAFMANTEPVFLDLTVDCAVPGGPIAGQTRINLRNEHLAYIITWYSLSIVTSWMWHRLFIKKLPLL